MDDKEEYRQLPPGVWNKVVALYRGLLTSDSDIKQMERHFPQFKSFKIKEGELLIGVDSEVQVEWFQPLYTEKLKNAVNSLMPDEISNVKFVVEETSSDKPYSNAYNASAADRIETEKSKPAEMARRRHTSAFESTVPINADYTFKKFVRGPSNSIAYATAMAVANGLGKNSYNPLFIYGGTGLGKTHLMQAIGNQVKASDPTKSVCYITAEIFLNKYLESIQNDTMPSFRERYRKIDLLLIDDVQFLAGKKQFQEEFFNTFNSLRDSEKQIVLTSDVSPKDLSGLEERLSSRFQQGVAIEIESPSYETRLAIMKMKAQATGRRIDDSILQYIAENIHSHVRALEGALTLCVTFLDANPGMEMTQEIMNHLLRDLIEEEKEIKRLSVNDIIKRVCEQYGVTEEDMKSQERTQPLATARQVAMFIARKLTGLSTNAIAKEFKKTYTTVIYSTKMIQDKIEVDSDLKGILENITCSLGRKPSELSD